MKLVEPLRAAALRQPSRFSRFSITVHLERHLGPVEGILRSPDGDSPIELLWIAPGPRRGFHTFVTSGMSRSPMSKPEGPCGCSPFAELMLRLPLDFRLPGQGEPRREAHWPLAQLIRLARIPQLDRTHFGDGHTVAMMDRYHCDAAPICETTRFCGWALREPTWTPPAFARLVGSGGRRLSFLSAIPVYEGELQIAYDGGTESLFARLDDAGVTDLLDVRRPDISLRVH